MSQSPTTHVLPLPTTVAVSDRGAVSIEHGSRFVAMSPFSERAKRLTLFFGPGTHVLTADTVADVSDVTVYDIAEALS